MRRLSTAFSVDRSSAAVTAPERNAHPDIHQQPRRAARRRRSRREDDGLPVRLWREQIAYGAAEESAAKAHQRRWADVGLIIVGGVLHLLEIILAGRLIVDAPVHGRGQSTNRPDGSHRGCGLVTSLLVVLPLRPT